MSNKFPASKVLIKGARLSYANIFVARAMNVGQDEKYSVSILISKTDTSAITAVKKAIAAAVEEGKAKKFNGKIPANLKLPLRDGDEDRPDDPNYAGHYFINANSTRKPDVLVKHNGSLSLATEEDVYSGCYAAVTVNFYAYDRNGNRGIAAGLGNILKQRDGERLSGGSNGQEDFGDVDIETADDEALDSELAALGL